jgi:1-deoxy-D-xylulose-5-phosphate synthase
MNDGLESRADTNETHAAAADQPLREPEWAAAGEPRAARNASAGSLPLLERIESPADLRRLRESELPQLAAELRAFLLETVARSGGHLAAGLGAIELTAALHYVFDTPRDVLVWDVGHQCYPHKVLTGRRDALHSIRSRGGLCGFLRRDESVFDAFGAGHSSTSISAALGMALAGAHAGADTKTVAIIGDGGLTAGLAWEALQHAGSTDADLLVVLNDNGMSISPNVGALSEYLGRLARRGPDAARAIHGATGRSDRIRALLGSARDAANQPFATGVLFEELGLRYYGPCDGHDVEGLVWALREVRRQTGPRLLHIVTRKGCGYAPAETDPVRYHGVTAFDPTVGLAASAGTARTCTEVFGDWLCEAATADERVVAITPAMREGSGLVKFAQRFPRRYFDVGIAEQHSVSLAAGLACNGVRPVVAIYSTFLQRAYDQLIHDVALQGLPVLFAIDRAGVVGPDGATHNGSFDLSYLRCIPGMTVMTPSDGAELRDMLHTGLSCGPAAVRYPRAAAAGEARAGPPRLLPIGRAELRRSGRRVAFLVFGSHLRTALTAAESLDATVIDMRFVKPLDERTVLEAARAHELLVTVEENAVAGGAGSAVNECLAAHGVRAATLNLGLPDRFLEHGTRAEVLGEAGLDLEGLLAAVEWRLKLGRRPRSERRRRELRKPESLSGSPRP